MVSKLTGAQFTATSVVTLNAPSIVKLSVAREEILVNFTRINQDSGGDAHSGETITIKKKLTLPTIRAQSQLVLAENDGTLWWVENRAVGHIFEQIAILMSCWSLLALPMKQALLGQVLAGAVAAGGTAAIASSGGGDSHHHSGY